MELPKPKLSSDNSDTPENTVLPLFNFNFRHHPDDPSSSTNNGEYVGRDQLLDRLLGILRGTKSTRGAYLVAGFRGAGKTSVINWALKIYNKNVNSLSWLPEIKTKRYEEREIKLSESATKWESDIHPSLKSRLSRFVKQKIADVRRLHIAIFEPLIHVRVNLGADQSLDPKKVLLTITLLLDKQLQQVESHLIRRVYRLLMSLIILVFFSFVFLNISYYLLYIVYYLIHSYQDIILPHSILSGHLDFPKLGKNYYENTPNLPSFFKYFENIGVLLLSGWFAWRLFLLFPSIILVRRQIKKLLRRITDTEESTQMVSGNMLSIIARFFFGQKTTSPPLNSTQIESELLNILMLARKCNPFFLGRPDIIFVFDELDKISPPLNTSFSSSDSSENEKLYFDLAPWAPRDVYQRKSAIDNLLSALKIFITEGQARFFFIAGREMLDSFQAEKGSASALYESLFDSVIEVPSLLTDPLVNKDGRINRLIEVFICRRILPPSVAVYHWYLNKKGHSQIDQKIDMEGKKAIQYDPFTLETAYYYIVSTGASPSEARRQILTLRMFISFLTIHSWGNPKRLMSLFEHFIKPWNNLSIDSQALQKKYIDTSKISNSKRLKILQNTHFLHFGIVDQQRILIASQVYVLFHQHLSRQFASIGDKQIVSALIALQFLIKFHRVAFSRSQLEYMGEALNIHRSPELNSVIDTLLSQVLLPDIRRIRNSLDRYRFTSGFEQEIRYISRVSDIESATFNFSLDATATVKQFFLMQLKRIDEDTNSLLTNRNSFPEIHIILGGLFYLEQSYEQALIHYQAAVDYYNDKTNLDIMQVVVFIEALLKLGDTHERRQRYEKAAASYWTASDYINNLLKKVKNTPV